MKYSTYLSYQRKHYCWKIYPLPSILGLCNLLFAFWSFACSLSFTNKCSTLVMSMCWGFNKQPVLSHGLSLECWVPWNKEAWSLTWSIENCLFRHQSFAISVYLKLEIPPVSSFVWMKVKEIVVSMFSCLETNWFGVVFSHQEIDFICYNEIS